MAESRMDRRSPAMHRRNPRGSALSSNAGPGSPFHAGCGLALRGFPERRRVDRDAHAARDAGAIGRIGADEVAQHALADVARRMIGRAGDVADQLGPLRRAHRALQRAGLRIVVVIDPTVIAPHGAGEVVRALVVRRCYR